MGTVGRLLMIFLLFGSLLVAVCTMFVWWLPAMALSAGALGFLGLGAVAARRDAQDPSWRSRRCADCATAVPEGAGVCPRCRGVDILDSPESLGVLRRDRRGERRREAQVHEVRDQEIERANRHVFLFGNIAGFMHLVGWYVRFMTGGMGMDPDNPADMRWWAACLFFLAGLFGTLGAAARFGSWSMGLPILFALLATSLYVAVLGPRSMAEALADARLSHR